MHGLSVRKIPGKEGREFIREHHYSRSCHNGPRTWGLFDKEDVMQGVIAFATPCSEAVRASVFGSEHKDKVTELHRLFTFDNLPTNTETWFIAMGLRGLAEVNPEIRGVVSYADTTEGHLGTVYQASNALYTGTSGKATFYRDQEGRLRHPRQSGVNISRAEASLRGWVPERREAKHRYVFLIGSKSDKKWGAANLLLPVLPYPKGRI